MMHFDSVGIKPDPACKDISRLSFAPMHKEILYYNPSLLFAELPEASDYPDGTIFSGVAGVRSEGVQTIPVTMDNGQTDSADGLSSSLLSEATTPELLDSQNKAADGLSSSLLSEAKLLNSCNSL